jgi:hypothetical protein
MPIESMLLTIVVCIRVLIGDIEPSLCSLVTATHDVDWQASAGLQRPRRSKAARNFQAATSGSSDDEDAPHISLAAMFHPVAAKPTLRQRVSRTPPPPPPPLDDAKPTPARVIRPPLPTPVHRKYQRKQSQVDKLLELKRNAQRIANQLPLEDASEHHALMQQQQQQPQQQQQQQPQQKQKPKQKAVGKAHASGNDKLADQAALWAVLPNAQRGGGKKAGRGGARAGDESNPFEALRRADAQAALAHRADRVRRAFAPVDPASPDDDSADPLASLTFRHRKRPK